MKDPLVPQLGQIQLGSHGVALDEVVAVARHGTRVHLAAEAHAAMGRSAALVDGFVAGNTPVYGVTTGFGSLASTVIPVERTAELQVALVRSHAAGMGDTVEPEVVRAMLFLRARSLAMAFSGARPEIVDLQLALLNAGLTPVVREHGSLGASGDLAPLSHCALAVIGEGEVWGPDGSVRPTAPALAAAGLVPVQ
ncbi:MAG: aromatic amino acid lyase, partial [Ilumatobacteraceae bacterium]